MPLLDTPDTYDKLPTILFQPSSPFFAAAAGDAASGATYFGNNFWGGSCRWISGDDFKKETAGPSGCRVQPALNRRLNNGYCWFLLPILRLAGGCAAG